ncbi:MAG: hypothetical protein M3400_04375, partial [Actinomycetota bacterium]|nr:hypothetical protein [Actinomycetota bacterium]
GRTGPARVGHAENTRTTGAALRRGLDGRGLSTIKQRLGLGSAPAAKARPEPALPATARAEELSAEPAQMLGDEGLFTVDPAAPAVIERAPEKEHAKRPGPALGLG